MGAELFKALLAARQQSGATVFKGGWNESQKYAYTGHLQVLTGGARQALLANGLALVQTSMVFAGAESTGKHPCWRWRGEYLLVHSSGETLPLVFEATTMTNDKAAFVASTALDRTAHMRVLELAGSDQENPEHDTNHDGGGNAPTTDVLGDFVRDLEQLSARPQLVQWARDLANFTTRDDKRAAWAAFGKRCQALNLDPSDVAGEARGKAA